MKLMKKYLKVLVSVALLGLVAWKMDWAQVGAAFARLRLELWLAAVGLYVSLQFVSGWRWRMLARPLGFQRPLGHYIGFYFIGMFFNLVLPTSVGGDVVRAWYLAGGRGRRFAAFISVLVDRGSGLVVLLALACGACLFSPNALPAWITWSTWLAASAAAAFVVSIFILGNWHIRLGRFSHFQQIVHDLHAFLLRPRLLLKTTALSLVVQAGNVVLVWLLGLAIAAPVPAYFYWIAVPMVSLLTVVLPSLNGMGVREGGLVLFMGVVGVPASTALTLAFLWFAVFTTVSLAGGLVYVFGGFTRPEIEEQPAAFEDQDVREIMPSLAA